MHQYPGFAGAGTGQYQHVCLVPIIRDDTLLDRIFQALDNGPPRFGSGLPFDFLVPVRQPALKEMLFLEAEVVHDQTQGFGHSIESSPREFHHHVDLPNLSLVVELQWLEVRGGETASWRFLHETDGHGLAEYRQPLVKANDLLIV